MRGRLLRCRFTAGTAALLCMALHAEHGYAQRVTGVVIADGARTPIAGAFVVLLADGGAAAASLLTDSIGGFALDGPGAGGYRLRIERLGYQTYTSPLIPLQRGETISVEVRLGPGAIPLEPIVVTARGGILPGRATEFHARRNHPAHTGTFITREDMEKSGAGGRTSDVLARAPAIALVPVCRAAPCTTPEYMVRLRGSAGADMDGVCEPAIFIDGAPVHQTAVGIDTLIDPVMLEGIEIYSSIASAPIQYTMGNDCGAVLFRTRLAERNTDWSWKRIAAGAAAAVGMAFLIVFR